MSLIINEAQIPTEGAQESYNAKKFNKVLVTVEYTKGDESSVDLNIDLSNSDDENNVWAALSDEMEAGGFITLQPKVFRFDTTGVYRFTMPKSVTEDFVRFTALPQAGTEGNRGSFKLYAKKETLNEN